MSNSIFYASLSRVNLLLLTSVYSLLVTFRLTFAGRPKTIIFTAGAISRSATLRSPAGIPIPRLNNLLSPIQETSTTARCIVHSTSPVLLPNRCSAQSQTAEEKGYVTGGKRWGINLPKSRFYPTSSSLHSRASDGKLRPVPVPVTLTSFFRWFYATAVYLRVGFARFIPTLHKAKHSVHVFSAMNFDSPCCLRQSYRRGNWDGVTVVTTDSARPLYLGGLGPCKLMCSGHFTCELSQ